MSKSVSDTVIKKKYCSKRMRGLKSETDPTWPSSDLYIGIR